MGPNDLRVANLTTPTFDAVGVQDGRCHDMANIPVHLDFDAAMDSTPNVRCLFHEALGIVIDHGNNACQPGSQLVKGHCPDEVAFFTGRAPHALFLRYLLDNRGVQCAVRPENLALKVNFLFGLLLDALDFLHEIGPVFELCPLVVGHRKRHTNIYGFDDAGKFRAATATGTPATAE